MSFDGCTSNLTEVYSFVLLIYLKKNKNEQRGQDDWSPGLVVMLGDLRSKGRGFESQRRTLNGHFSH